MMNRIVVIGIILVFLVIGFSGCNELSNTINPITNRIVGDWDGGAIKINISSDGIVKYSNYKDRKSAIGSWGVKDDTLTFDFSYCNSINWKYQFYDNDKTLSLTVTKTGQVINFTKQ